MKRLKDFLILFIPFVVFTALPVAVFVTSTGDNAIIGNSHYMSLFLKDGLLWGALANTYIRALIFAVVYGITVAALCAFIRALRSRKIFYCACISGAGVIAFVCIFFSRKTLFGMPMGVYDPNYLINHTPTKTPISIWDILIALQIAFLTALLFFFAEIIYRALRKKK